MPFGGPAAAFLVSEQRLWQCRCGHFHARRGFFLEVLPAGCRQGVKARPSEPAGGAPPGERHAGSGRKPIVLVWKIFTDSSTGAAQDSRSTLLLLCSETTVGRDGASSINDGRCSSRHAPGRAWRAPFIPSRGQRALAAHAAAAHCYWHVRGRAAGGSRSPSARGCACAWPRAAGLPERVPLPRRHRPAPTFHRRWVAPLSNAWPGGERGGAGVYGRRGRGIGCGRGGRGQGQRTAHCRHGAFCVGLVGHRLMLCRVGGRGALAAVG